MPAFTPTKCSLQTRSGSYSAVNAGIERAVDPDGNPATDDGAHVINMSLGGGGNPDDPVCQATDNAVAAGVVVAVAAGNSGSGYQTLGSPGMARQALTVGATDKSDKIAYFSSRGPAPFTLQIKPEITAPGVAITSTVPRGSCSLCDASGYKALNGTSMATPMRLALPRPRTVPLTRPR
jgi:subtilisin family serine protease